MKNYLLEFIVFISGSAIMVFELIGSRILAPFVGTTVLVWSCLIGVILASLALGYWWGGKKADKQPEYSTFSALMFWATLFVILTAFFKLPIIHFLDKHIGDIRLESILASLILFGPGSFFLASISPYAVRLRIENVKSSGATVGNLYAVSTVGSIVGTFLTGLVLVIYLGNTKILFGLAAVLLLTSLLAFSQKYRKAKIAGTALIVVLLVFANSLDRLFLPKSLVYINSQYMDIMVDKGIDTFSQPSTSRPVLKLFTGFITTQSAMFTDTPNSNELVFPYTQFFRLAFHFNPQIKNSLLIGGAGYSWPKYYLQTYPTANIDVVELDPQMTAVAKKYFNLPDNSRLTTYNEDGRIFLNRNQKKYDAIIEDAFRLHVIPFQLTTQETVQHIYDALNPDGVVMVNMVSAITGDEGGFLRAEYATYKKVFPQVYVFRVNFPFPQFIQNQIIVGLKSNQPAPLTDDNKDLNAMLQHLYTDPIPTDRAVLTDDFAPVHEYGLKAFDKF